jgi:two-component system, OmpR family, sensor histidine kinase SenX3
LADTGQLVDWVEFVKIRVHSWIILWMLPSGRRKSIVFFITLCSVLVVAAAGLNVGWILLNWRQVALLVLGIVVFCVIIAGLILNTIFLVREIRRNEQHDAFINAVTHELKTPIASIRLYLETLKTREVDAARRSEFYDIMLSDSDRLLKTVEQVLEAGRTGQRQRPKARTPVDLTRLVRECVDAARVRVAATEGTLGYSETLEGERRAVVLGEADELRAAVSNLIDNAIKYSPSAAKIDVEVVLAEGKKVEVRVRDKGIGVPRDQLKRIFKRFYRLPGRRAGEARGTGLGLSIVGAVARRHGGKAFAESEGRGHGSTFTISLPRARG